VDPVRRESEAAVVVAPDGSSVRPLSAVDRGSMATFRLAPGQVAAAVVHRTVDELWFVVSGSGQLWRRDAGGPGEIAPLDPGVAVDLPVGTAFQFRAAADSELVIVGVTMPPWPGDDEAVAADGPSVIEVPCGDMPDVDVFRKLPRVRGESAGPR
jgi:mannose-6-phosphate isomerase-like protein (cupin superfamily)